MEIFTVLLSFSHTYLYLNFKLCALFNKLPVRVSVNDWSVVIDVSQCDLQYCAAGLSVCVFGLQSG